MLDKRAARKATISLIAGFMAAATAVSLFIFCVWLLVTFPWVGAGFVLSAVFAGTWYGLYCDYKRPSKYD